MKIVVLGGAGAMGQVIVRDLIESAEVQEVVVADYSKDKAEALVKRLKSKKGTAAFADIRDRDSLVPVLENATAVINSTPYYFNVTVMESALKAACHYLDLGGLFHVTQRQMELHDQFAAKGLIAVLGMGAAPGMTNVMAAAAAAELDEVSSIDIAIGCVDFTKTEHPFLPPYAIDTILDEYTKEPMVFENGQFAAKPPMSGEVEIDFPKPVGRAKAILTLHSEVATLPLSYRAKGVKEVTFRLGLPEEFHSRLKFLVNLGFAGNETLFDSAPGSTPRKALAMLLEKIPVEQGDPDDCEVVRVEVQGHQNGRPARIRMETTVYAHKKWGVSCGALDTGVPPSIVAQMIGSGKIKERGVLAPEQCVPCQEFFQELAKRTIVMRRLREEALA